MGGFPFTPPEGDAGSSGDFLENIIDTITTGSFEGGTNSGSAGD